jgi:hypothetical protein
MSGNLLDGKKTGHPGSDFLIDISHVPLGRMRQLRSISTK